MDVSNVPHDIMIDILIYLEMRDIITMRQTNKHMYTIIGNDDFWRRKYLFDYGKKSPINGIFFKEFYKIPTIVIHNSKNCNHCINLMNNLDIILREMRKISFSFTRDRKKSTLEPNDFICSWVLKLR
jgi:hypothetical protein